MEFVMDDVLIVGLLTVSVLLRLFCLLMMIPHWCKVHQFLLLLFLAWSVYFGRCLGIHIDESSSCFPF